MTNLEEITFNVTIQHPDGRQELVTTTAYDMSHAEYKVKNSNPFAAVIKATPAEMF